MMREGNLKEINICEIISKNFERKIRNLYVRSYDSIYDALHSSEYRKVSQRNFDCIHEGFEIAVVELEYLSPKGSMVIRVPFLIHFDFEYAERKKCSWNNIREYPSGERFSVKPILGIDEVSIDFPEFLDRKNLDLLNDNLPQGGGRRNGVFIQYSISGMHCEGHQMELSHKTLEMRIVDYFNYLFGMIDSACLYSEHPELKPKIVEVEQSSYYKDGIYEPDDDYYL